MLRHQIGLRHVVEDRDIRPGHGHIGEPYCKRTLPMFHLGRKFRDMENGVVMTLRVAAGALRAFPRTVGRDSQASAR